MTDKDIIKALGLCTSEHLGCEDGCPYIPRDIEDEFCSDALKKDALDLINRQQAEIDGLIDKLERLLCHATNGKLSYHTYSIETMETNVTDAFNESYDEGYNDGIKEFAERIEYFVLNEDPEINELKCKDYGSYMGGANQFRLQIVKGINNTLKEMVGDAE